MTAPNFLSNYGERDGLTPIHNRFSAFLQDTNAPLFKRYVKTSLNYQLIDKENISNLLIESAQILDAFLKKEFNLKTNCLQQKQSADIHWVKQNFIKRIKSKPRKDVLIVDDIQNTIGKLTKLVKGVLSSHSFSESIRWWLTQQDHYHEQLELAKEFCTWALSTQDGQEFVKNWPLFDFPKKLDHQTLLDIYTGKDGSLNARTYNNRHGFSLTDPGPTANYALDQSLYCLFCHNRKKDSCSTGKYSKTGKIETNMLGQELRGCPLKQKISEMNWLASQGFIFGALAVAMIDNPLLLVTGHRICQDCSRACIFQKQTPVDIPAIESFIVSELMKTPWGFEIYNLLSLWNPLNFERPLPKPKTHKKVLVVGMGPAGFTLAYHLLMEGHTVIAMEGMKIEPLPKPLDKNIMQPIKFMNDHFQSLDERLPSGFGGVAEYGITVRWNKNLLLPIRVMLERWEDHFTLIGSTRFGSTVTFQEALENFDHVALCTGAGKPSAPTKKNAFTKNVRMASDFLMALHTSGSQNLNSLVPLAIDLPCIIIGGGLTAVDAATEAQAHYLDQISKVSSYYHKLKREMGDKNLKSFLKQSLSTRDQRRLERWLSHGKEYEEEKAKARRQKHTIETTKLLKSWGGVHLLYRKTLQNSPAYRTNHSELQKALEEGVTFWENLEVEKISPQLDKDKDELLLRYKKNNIIKWKFGSIIWATGTQKNSASTIKQAFSIPSPEEVSLPSSAQDFIIHTSQKYTKEKKSVSCFGDAHPFYEGSVVKAMASAKNGYKTITQCLETNIASRSLCKQVPLVDGLKASVSKNLQHKPGFHELIVHAPQAAKNFQPGQLYRVQPYASQALKLDNNFIRAEPIALTAAKVNKMKGTIHFLVWVAGASSYVLSRLKKGDPISVMGPTGCATKVVPGEKVMLVAGQLGIEIGKKMRQQGAEVLYVSSFRNGICPLTTQDFVEASDHLLICSPDDIPKGFSEHPSLIKTPGLTLDAIDYYKNLDNPPIPFDQFDRIIVIGSTSLLKNFYDKVFTQQKDSFKDSVAWIMAVTTPMQCMMQGVCGQCLQAKRTTNTKTHEYIFSCSTQDQNMEELDIPFMQQRLSINKITEEILNTWMKENLKK